MTEKLEPVNPYESPRLHSSDDVHRFADTELDRLVRRADIAFDVLVVVVCIVFPVIFCIIGTDLARRGAGLGGSLFRAGPDVICWSAWVAGIMARLVGQCIGGWMLGRFLRRLNLWCVVALILVCLAAVAAWFIVSWFVMPLDFERHFYVLLIGYPGYVMQVVVSTLVASGVVVGGAWMGRRSQQAVDARLTSENSPGRVVSSLYATFAVGQREVHEVGVLFTAGGREIVTVDGQKELDRRSFALWASRSLTVGADERHDIEIRSKTMPLWSVQAFVDGQPHAKELFHDVRLLFKLTMTMLAVLVAIAVIMASVLVFMMTSAV